MTGQTRDILTELKEGLLRIYGDRMDSLILFGSQARGDAQPDSDIDVLIVLHDDFSLIEELERSGDLVSDLCLKYDVVLSCQFVRRDGLSSPSNSFIRNIVREGVAV